MQLQKVQQQLLEEKSKNACSSTSAHTTKVEKSEAKPKKGNFDTHRTKYVGQLNHKEWLAKKLACRSQRSAPDSSDQVNSVKLAILEKIEACLMTKAVFREEEATALFAVMPLN